MVRTEEEPIRIVGFMPTPFTEDERIDVARLTALSEQIASVGVHPAVLGGMGEYYALNKEESRECMTAAIAGARGVPVVAGIGWSTREAEQLATDAGMLGVDTLVINPPYYAKPSPQGYAEHVRRVTEAAGIGAIVYSSAHYPMTEAHLEQLASVDGFLGVKEEHYSVAETANRIAVWGERIQWWGVGEMGGSAYARVGADAVTSSLSNIRPDLAVRAITALVNGTEDADAIQAAQAWQTALGADQQGSPAFLTEVMHRVAGWNRAVRLPLLPSDPESQEAVETFLRTWAAEAIGHNAFAGRTR
ncbi:dihydrodipicolinate synthase family protein [Arthrobacter sp. CAU 1506]|uniref:dihydrodipicolinate synthase family protein n=1 Tax=Arthrobacter sp. CAU 1506 TaxID=2560052 RepID=UPI0010AD632E|nr:dihydrodipicolinate synthase family protein [Arthrobacter sp. CAU 1506]TJY66223.1 dihydrodipicolinate synthase family protein [Arthrobacter sp. CAU 1506]